MAYQCEAPCAVDNGGQIKGASGVSVSEPKRIFLLPRKEEERGTLFCHSNLATQSLPSFPPSYVAAFNAIPLPPPRFLPKSEGLPLRSCMGQIRAEFWTHLLTPPPPLLLFGGKFHSKY